MVVTVVCMPYATAHGALKHGRFYFADRPRGRRPIQKDKDACLFASFDCSSENGSHSWKGEGRGNPNPNPKRKLPTIDLSLNHSLLLPQLSLPFSELLPKEAKRRAHVPILLYRSASARTVHKIESSLKYYLEQQIAVAVQGATWQQCSAQPNQLPKPD